MGEYKAYAGIGSRSTPPYILTKFEVFGKRLAELGYVLRSGGADGADSAFERGCDLARGDKEIYLPWGGFNGNTSPLFPPSPPAFRLASDYHPTWSKLSSGAQKLHARNSHQVLGGNLDSPAKFIICYTDKRGGTTQALRIAEAYKIPVFNLFDDDLSLEDILKSVEDCKRLQ